VHFVALMSGGCPAGRREVGAVERRLGKGERVDEEGGLVWLALWGAPELRHGDGGRERQFKRSLVVETNGAVAFAFHLVGNARDPAGGIGFDLTSEGLTRFREGLERGAFPLEMAWQIELVTGLCAPSIPRPFSRL